MRAFFANLLPELYNCETKETERMSADVPPVKEKVVTFSKRVGTKGFGTKGFGPENPPVYEIRPVTMEDIKGRSIGIFVNGELSTSYKDQKSAEDEVNREKQFIQLEDDFEAWVATQAIKLNLTEYEVFRMLEEIARQNEV